ncbi:hypothetical protein Zmor_027751 [Zophobas morio]|uniref:Uncharacterized protein n=1 Tax=Zophobas morio TaxID=2755281 RepID=A0AA38HPL0_9CUCU|nr:hypothetical protein Zmor_027751 [Zophobas morio]
MVVIGDGEMNLDDEEPKQGIYLPSQDKGVDTRVYLNRYIKREFPHPKNGASAVYSVPKMFQKSGEKQASLAEQEVFEKLKGVDRGGNMGLWMTFFHSASYGGHSFRNQRVGKLMIREHDFVLFITYRGSHFVALVEVKSTNDQNSNKNNLEKVSDAKVIKNNKRSAQHQLRDHLEVLEGVLGGNPQENGVQSYIMWPFLGANTKDPKQQTVKRWKEDKNLHVFEDTIEVQEKFDGWLLETVLAGTKVPEAIFDVLLNRFVILSCGVFVDEIDRGLMALLTQEQFDLLHSNTCQHPKALVVHGAAGTGKTLLVLRKLELLHRAGRLNEDNRALYICYWPGIRYELELKMEALGIREFVDTARFYISIPDFLKNNKNVYKHVFMDEAEALCLALDDRIIKNTLATIYKKYHDGNCTRCGCNEGELLPVEDITDKLNRHQGTATWGALWFMVDINQASLFLPKHSPKVLKTPSILLTKVMRSTGYIFTVFKQFYSVPMPLLPKKIQDSMHIPEITIGHHVFGPPIYWVDSQHNIDKVVAKVIIDLCTSKGFKPHDLCVIPFLVNEKLVPESINKYIDEEFVENSFRPNAVRDVEHFLKYREINNFLIAWALRVKGLEFKVVIMAIDEDDFDFKDAEDRKKAYIMASRCTSMLIVVSREGVRNDMELAGRFEKYPFSNDL